MISITRAALDSAQAAAVLEDLDSFELQEIKPATHVISISFFISPSFLLKHLQAQS